MGWYGGGGTRAHVSASLDLVGAEVEAMWVPLELGGVGVVGGVLSGEDKVEKGVG